MNKALGSIGNLIHDSVPVDNNEDNNPIITTWVPADREVAVGEEDRSKLLSHHELLLRIDGYNPEAGVKVVGHRGYFLKNWGVSSQNLSSILFFSFFEFQSVSNPLVFSIGFPVRA